MSLGQCQAYTTRTIPLARGARRYIGCVQPATQERQYTERHLRSETLRTVRLCPRHVGMFDRGQTGILESRA